MIIKIETLEKKLKGLQHLIGATDDQVMDAHDDAVKAAALAEDDVKAEAAASAKVGADAIAARLKAKK